MSERGARGLLDTSTVILLPEIAEPESLPHEPLISAITFAALSVGPLIAATDHERDARQAHVQQAEADFDPLPFDAAARIVGRVPLRCTCSGRKPPARTLTSLSSHTLSIPDGPRSPYGNSEPAGELGWLRSGLRARPFPHSTRSRARRAGSTAQPRSRCGLHCGLITRRVASRLPALRALTRASVLGASQHAL